MRRRHHRGPDGVERAIDIDAGAGETSPNQRRGPDELDSNPIDAAPPMSP
jgi:hypothetical protein